MMRQGGNARSALRVDGVRGAANIPIARLWMLTQAIQAIIGPAGPRSP